MSKQFRISFTCTESQLVTIISVLTKEVRGLTVAEADPARKPMLPHAHSAIKPSRSSHYAKSNSYMAPHETRIGKLLMPILESKSVVHIKELGPIVEAAGFKRNSYSPVLSRMKHLGMVEMLGLGQWRLTKTNAGKGGAAKSV